MRMKDKVYYAIINHIETHGYPPTVREIAQATGIKSTNTVFKHLKRLEQDGRISVKTDSPRAIRLTEYDIELRPKVKENK